MTNKTDSAESREVGEINVKLDVDVSEALTGLKAVQREARKATSALAEFKEEQEKDGIETINSLRDIQGSEGNWNYSEYMLGMFNGLELASATMEGRRPDFKEPPSTYSTHISLDGKEATKVDEGESRKESGDALSHT